MIYALALARRETSTDIPPVSSTLQVTAGYHGMVLRFGVITGVYDTIREHVIITIQSACIVATGAFSFTINIIIL